MTLMKPWDRVKQGSVSNWGMHPPLFLDLRSNQEKSRGVLEPALVLFIRFTNFAAVAAPVKARLWKVPLASELNCSSLP